MSTSRDKLKSLGELIPILDACRADGRKVVLCHGVFDVLHSGHIFHFKAAKQHGDVLVVTLTPDRFVRKGPERPRLSERVRQQVVAEIEAVDYVAVNEWPTAIETIRALRPDVYAKGDDYGASAKDPTGNIDREAQALRETGGTMVFTDEQAFSSSALINAHFPTYSEAAADFLNEFKSQHTLDEVHDYLDRIARLRVLVVGEAILDRYTYCVPMGKSTKDTIIAARYTSREDFVGGAIAVANHVSNVCAGATLVTSLGSGDDVRALMSARLNSSVTVRDLPSNGRPTIVKERFVEHQFLSKMFEVQQLDDRPIDGDTESALLEIIDAAAEDHDLVVVADYGHGLVTGRVVDALTKSRMFLAVNVQSNSANLGFNLVTKFPRADYACIDEPELKFAAHRKHAELPEMVAIVKSQTAVPRLMVSRGAKGTVFFDDQMGTFASPTFSNRVVDRTGAGDAVFSVTSPLALIGCPPEILNLVANCAGALAVKTVGNRHQVELAELKQFVRALLA